MERIGKEKSEYMFSIFEDQNLDAPEDLDFIENPPYLELVMDFHYSFNHPVMGAPSIDSEAVNDLRVALLQEELEELAMALKDKDKVGVLDALCDLQYVLNGAILSLGYLPVFDPAFREVHRSNMSKLGEDGKPIYREDGKVLKGPNYTEPDLEQFVK